MKNTAILLNMQIFFNTISNVTLSICILFATATVNAEPQTYIRNYSYQASELDSKVTARIATLGQVKHMLLSELGTYVNSTAIIKKSSDGRKFSRLEITELAGGVIHTDITKETWDGKTYYAELKMIADPEEVARTLRDQSKLTSVGKPIYVAVHDSNDKHSKNLMNKSNKIALLARHEISYGSDSSHNSDSATKSMLLTLRDVLDGKLQGNFMISAISDFDVTNEMLWETKKGDRSKYICSLYSADYVVASILEDHDGQGYLREVDMYIYECGESKIAHRKFRPVFSNDGRYGRENSIRQEFSNFLNEYIADNG